MKYKIPLITIAIAIFSSALASAHCPLCTISAGAVAIGASWAGISKVVIGLFIGAFAMSMGIWFSKIPKKQYIPLQKTAIILAVFLATLIPLIPITKAIGPLYLPFIGQYGATYAFDYSIASSLLGAFIVAISPKLSKKITDSRNGKKIKFQCIILTFTLLIIAGAIIQLTI